MDRAEEQGGAGLLFAYISCLHVLLISLAYMSCLYVLLMGRGEEHRSTGMLNPKTLLNPKPEPYTLQGGGARARGPASSTSAQSHLMQIISETLLANISAHMEQELPGRR
jgi:hypothetical protein